MLTKFLILCVAFAAASLTTVWLLFLMLEYGVNCVSRLTNYLKGWERI